MRARRIPVMLFQEWQHRIQHVGRNRGRRVVGEIDLFQGTDLTFRHDEYSRRVDAIIIHQQGWPLGQEQIFIGVMKLLLDRRLDGPPPTLEENARGLGPVGHLGW